MCGADPENLPSLHARADLAPMVNPSGTPAVNVFLCPRLSFVGNRLQPPGPPLSPRGQIQTAVDQGRADTETRRTTCSQIGGAQARYSLILPATASPNHGYESEVKSEAARSCPTLCNPWTVAYQAPPSMEFSRQDYWSRLPFPSPGDLLDPGMEPESPTWQADALPSEPPGNLKLLTESCVSLLRLTGFHCAPPCRAKQRSSSFPCTRSSVSEIPFGTGARRPRCRHQRWGRETRLFTKHACTWSETLGPHSEQRPRGGQAPGVRERERPGTAAGLSPGTGRRRTLGRRLPPARCVAWTSHGRAGTSPPPGGPAPCPAALGAGETGEQAVRGRASGRALMWPGERTAGWDPGAPLPSVTGWPAPLPCAAGPAGERVTAADAAWQRSPSPKAQPGEREPRCWESGRCFSGRGR